MCKGPNLPIGLAGHATITLEDALIVIGGATDPAGSDPGDIPQPSLYILKCYQRDCSWSKMAQELSTLRYYPVAIVIPDELAKCEYLI